MMLPTPVLISRRLRWCLRIDATNLAACFAAGGVSPGIAGHLFESRMSLSSLRRYSARTGDGRLSAEVFRSRLSDRKRLFEQDPQPRQSSPFQLQRSDGIDELAFSPKLRRQTPPLRRYLSRIAE